MVKGHTWSIVLDGAGVNLHRDVDRRNRVLNKNVVDLLIHLYKMELFKKGNIMTISAIIQWAIYITAFAWVASLFGAIVALIAFVVLPVVGMMIFDRDY